MNGLYQRVRDLEAERDELKAQLTRLQERDREATVLITKANYSHLRTGQERIEQRRDAFLEKAE